MILVDTSVWIEVFRRTSPIQVREVGELDEIVTCLPILRHHLTVAHRDRDFDLLARVSSLSVRSV